MHVYKYLAQRTIPIAQYTRVHRFGKQVKTRTIRERNENGTDQKLFNKGYRATDRKQLFWAAMQAIGAERTQNSSPDEDHAHTPFTCSELSLKCYSKYRAPTHYKKRKKRL